MSKCHVSSLEIQNIPHWGKLDRRRVPLSFDLETTARWNLDCRHCYIKLPAADRTARAQEIVAPETMYDLRKGTLREAWEQLGAKSQ